MEMRFGDSGLWFMIEDLGVEVCVSGLWVEGLRFKVRVWGSDFGLQDSRIMV